MEQNNTAAPAAQAGEASAEAVQLVLDEVMRLDRSRNILYKMLGFCAQGCSLDELEGFVASLPEAKRGIAEPYSYVGRLEQVCGIVVSPVDARGNILDAAYLESLSDDEYTALLAGYRACTTPAGLRAMDLLAPEARMRAKLGERPERFDTYLAVLDFCKQPRTLAEVKGLFEKDDSLNREPTIDNQPLSVDFYLSELEKAGGLAWDDGWHTTDEGLAFLEAARSGNQ